jgi:hypothetical protein
MQHKTFALIVSVLALASLGLATPALAAGKSRTVAYSKKVTSVGNSTTIIVSGGNQPVVQQTSSCSPGISGYLYQSIVVIFGGSTISTTQSIYCP